MHQLGAKDIALVAWALARTKLQNESPLFRKLKDRMLILIKDLQVDAVVEGDGELSEDENDEVS